MNWLKPFARNTAIAQRPLNGKWRERGAWHVGRELHSRGQSELHCRAATGSRRGNVETPARKQTADRGGGSAWWPLPHRGTFGGGQDASPQAPCRPAESANGECKSLRAGSSCASEGGNGTVWV